VIKTVKMEDLKTCQIKSSL